MTEKKRWKFEAVDLMGPKPLPTVVDEGGARRFFQYLYDPLGLIWHPDTAFEDYVELSSGERIFSPRACDLLDGTMARCFKLFEDRVYDIALEEHHEFESGGEEGRRVRMLLASRGLPYQPCGLNADWAVSAWRLTGEGEPNTNDGDTYLLDEEDRDKDGRALYRVVTRSYTADTSEDGNDDVVTLQGPGRLEAVVNRWIFKQENTDSDTCGKEADSGNATPDGGQSAV